MNAKGQMYSQKVQEHAKNVNGDLTIKSFQTIIDSQKVQELVKNVGDNHGNQKRTILKRTYRKKEQRTD